MSIKTVFMKNIQTIITMCAFTFCLACGCTNCNNGQLPLKEGSLEEVYLTETTTDFSFWAPTANEVVLNLYHDGAKGEPFNTIKLKRHKDGSWRTSIEGNLTGIFYTFKAKIGEKWLEETPGIFARATGVNGARAAIVDFSALNPQGWDEDKAPLPSSFNDIILYELHHRDFSIDPSSGIVNRGKFLALTEKGTTNAKGASTGIDHLKELGVTHIHLMPSYDYSSVDEEHLERNEYNWGYDPVNYNTPEGSYSTDPFDPIVRIKEFKQMVKALHEAGICVVMDVVYNHLSDAGSSAFERSVPGYFFRMKEDGGYADASGCGNETASEREMMRRFMVESVVRWVKEYHIDGFRFDLMGIHDITTMNQIRKALDEISPNIVIYGEGWAASTPAFDADSMAMKANIYRMPGIAAFSDELRDAIRGPFSNDEKAGFFAVEEDLRESIKFGIAGAIEHPQIDYSKVNYTDRAWAAEPSQMISYVSCHDDLCLVDRIKASLGNPDEKEIIKLDKLAQTIVFTSQGIPFIYAGEEVFRNKKGVHNTFKSPDDVNAINWNNKTRYRDLFEYYQGLIALRKAHPAFRLASADLVRKHLEFLPSDNIGVVAFALNGNAGGDVSERIVVIFNANDQKVDVDIPAGDYIAVCAKGKIDLAGLFTVSSDRVRVGAREALILCSNL